MKKLGFVAHSPASANSLYPLIHEIRALGDIELHLYAYHDYVAELWGTQKQVFSGDYPKELSTMDLIVYGTGSSNDIELNVPVFCREYGISSIAIHDIYWGAVDGLRVRYRNAPDIIVVPNEEAKAQLASVGVISTHRILPLGNPHFDRLATYVKDYSVGAAMSVAFFSQCSTTGDYSDTGEMSKKALLDILEFQKEYPSLISKLYITPHPREDGVWLKRQIAADNVVYLERGGTELMLTADVIYGDTCTLQYEAQMIGKPVVFYEQKEQVYQELLAIQAYKPSAPKVSFDATEKCTALIRNVLQKGAVHVKE